MKNLKKLAAFLAIAVLLFSCTNDAQEIEANGASITAKATNSLNTVYSTNSLVIKYADGINDTQKQILRNYYEVLSYEICDHCDDNAIELWIFQNGIDIEPKKTTIDDGPPAPPAGPGNLPTQPITKVDYQFDFLVDSSSSTLNTSINSNIINGYQQYIKDTNEGVTIAVFDTGINPSIDGGSIFQNQFLYNASNDGIPGIYSGWDFVNHDNDCFDDNPGVHGTVVSSIITDVLNSSNYQTPHQILPLKICDKEGKANYFNFLCATSYALERAEILQMSLGWYDNDSGDLVDNIFLDLMSQFPNAIIINSAGNYANNNDVNIHLPSGYPLDNIITIASCNEHAVSQNSNLLANISSFSNYGETSVDYFANGENLYFLGHPMNGTSFAAPKVAAIIAKYIYLNPNYTIDMVNNNLFNLGIPCQTTFNSNKPVYHNKILIP